MNKRVGRPVKPAPGTGRVALSLRVTSHMKRMLEHAAATSGRSLSQEAELRLERSFDHEAVEAILRSTIDSHLDNLAALERRAAALGRGRGKKPKP
jgi:hypothetical protein